MNLQVVFDVMDMEGSDVPMLGQPGHCLSAINELGSSLGSSLDSLPGHTPDDSWSREPLRLTQIEGVNANGRRDRLPALLPKRRETLDRETRSERH